MTRLAALMRPDAAHAQRLVGPAGAVWRQECAQWLRAPFHCVFWGPPGSGKTTLARLLSEASGLPYIHLSAVRDGVREIRDSAAEMAGKLLFIDEIHRLTRSQQDVLLPILEHDECWIVGATTESPRAVFQPALLSRIRLIKVLQPSASDVAQAVEAGLACGADFEAGKAPSDSSLLTSARDAWNEYRGQILNAVGGDIRLSWNVLENLAATRLSAAQGGLTDASAAAAAVFENLQRSFTSTKHYDYASAMIKSMRGSDPDAALYYAIAALDSGEDILFLLRRCLIFASEDVGNADPQALGVAANAHYSASQTGLPEARIPLAQAVTYLAATVKSNSSYVAIDEVRAWRQQAEQSVVCGNAADLEPPACIVIKGSPDYVYPHDMADAFHRMEYLPKAVAAIRRVTGAAYRPSERGVESRIAERLRRLWEKIGG